MPTQLQYLEEGLRSGFQAAANRYNKFCIQLGKALFGGKFTNAPRSKGKSVGRKAHAQYCGCSHCRGNCHVVKSQRQLRKITQK